MKLLGSLAGILCTSSALAQYTITEIASCDTTIASVGGVTKNGTVAWSCWHRNSSELFLLDRDGYRQVGQAEPGFLHVAAMNRWEQIVGTVQSDQTIRGLLWSGGIAQELPSLPSLEDGSPVPAGINDRGDIVGGVTTPAGAQRAFLYRDGVMHDLGAFGVFASAINNRGQILMTFYDRAARTGIYENGALHPLPMIGSINGGLAINDSGSVAGWYVNVSGEERHAFLYSRTGLVDLRRGDETLSFANSINKHDEVVGFWIKVGRPDGGARGFLYKDGVRIDLNDLLPPNSGWRITSADHINDSGQIVGTGLLNGEARVYLLSANRKP
jgi:probable HAF family extracellular repeat protein